MTMLSPLRRWWFVVAFQLLLACTWHPRYGRASTTATAQTTSRDSIEADAGVMTNGSKRILQKTTPRPSTRRPTSPTRNPTNKPTTRNPVSFLNLVARSLDIHRVRPKMLHRRSSSMLTVNIHKPHRRPRQRACPLRFPRRRLDNM